MACAGASHLGQGKRNTSPCETLVHANHVQTAQSTQLYFSLIVYQGKTQLIQLFDIVAHVRNETGLYVG